MSCFLEPGQGSLAFSILFSSPLPSASVFSGGKATVGSKGESGRQGIQSEAGRGRGGRGGCFGFVLREWRVGTPLSYLCKATLWPLGVPAAAYIFTVHGGPRLSATLCPIFECTTIHTCSSPAQVPAGLPAPTQGQADDSSGSFQRLRLFFTASRPTRGPPPRCSCPACGTLLGEGGQEE